MNTKTTRAIVGAMVAMLLAASTVMAQVAYGGREPWNQRAESGPDAKVPGWFYNLGLTGIRAESVADEPKALLVKYVFPTTPASKVIKVDDKIIGAGGKLFQYGHRNGYGMEIFGADGPVAELAEALETCQGKSGTGKLPLRVKRGKETINVDLDIGRNYGTFYYQPNRDNAGYDSEARMTASSVVAFIFTIPQRSLVITGKDVPPAK